MQGVLTYFDREPLNSYTFTTQEVGRQAAKAGLLFKRVLEGSAVSLGVTCCQPITLRQRQLERNFEAEFHMLLFHLGHFGNVLSRSIRATTSSRTSLRSF